MGLITSLLPPVNATSTVDAFEVDATSPHYSAVGLTTILFGANYYKTAIRYNPTPAVNDEVVYAVPPLHGGTWNLVLLCVNASDQGIYTIETSADASTWTSVSTIDAYAATATDSVRETVTGVTITDGHKFVRLRMAAKDALSSTYGGQHSSISGVRTGA